MIYRFGNCELDSESYELHQEGQKIEIGPRGLDILLYLLKNCGRLITREELLDHCWPGAYVSDDTLTTAIGRLRRAISQSHKKQDRIIETVHRKGYRFLVEVSEHPNELPGQVSPTPSSVQPEAALPEAAAATAVIAAAAVQQQANRVEVKQLTVLNCTFVDMQTLLATQDAVKIQQIMQTLHRIISEVSARFGGYFAHHRQDTMQIYFGYPVAHEDDAQRAIRSGLQLIEELARHHFNANIGIHSGSVIIDQALASDNSVPMISGLTPSIAEQLSRLTKEYPTVIISDATAQLGAGYFELQTLESLPVPGWPAPDQSETIDCHQVLGDKQQTRLQVSEALHGLTPYIGRSIEQALLLERWAQACDAQGQTVLLSGDAGIGKSRLLQTLTRHAEIATQQWLECQCSPYHQNTPFYPLTRLLVQLLQWQEEDDDGQRLQALETFLNTYQLPLHETVPLLADRLALTLPVGRYPALSQDAQHNHQQLLELLLTLLLELQQASGEPLLFVVEDLHWIDPSTLEFVDLFVTQTPTLPILLVLTARPEFNPAWSMPELITPLALTRFNTDQIRQMLSRITDNKTLPDVVLQHIIEKADGIPLFIEEMTHSLLESGQLQETEQAFELSGPLDSLSVPLTLKDSLVARLDRLGEAKEVARWGAVIGREFSYRLLAAVTPFDDNLLQRYLDELLGSGLVHRRGLAARAIYLFKHALVQDITYQSLLKRQRREFHQRIADALESAFPETATQRPELLAQHHEVAGQLETALAYWQRAGERAVQSAALKEALAHFNRALALLRELPASESLLRIELTVQIALGPLWVALKGQAAEEVERTYQRADELCLRLGENEQRFPILWGLWRLHNNRADLVTTHQLARQLLDLAQRQEGNNKDSLLLEAHLACANTAITLGEFSSADQHIQQGLALYDHDQHHSLTRVFGGWEPGVYALTLAALSQGFRGYLQQTLQLSKQMLELARQSSEPYTLASALQYGCLHQGLLGRIETVQTLAEELVALASEHSFSTRLYIGRCYLGWALAKQGDSNTGITLIQDGLAAYARSGTLLGRPVWHYILIDAYVDNQQYPEALQVLNDTFAIIEQTREYTLLAELYRLQGECFYGQNDEQQAEDSFQQALSNARQQQAKTLELRAATSLARLWQTQHKPGDAYELLLPVYNWFSEDSASADLSYAKNLLAQLAA